ncbi:unnamed protein product [Moneuplotes crassus]|uniref:Uncharacterized protein n=1 Tax=Euplotes crassus TaxID=5936 RepID=A0AAD1Y478_EUPCR|nr:unnamed protein product [Moneuplotes crassus]
MLTKFDNKSNILQKKETREILPENESGHDLLEELPKNQLYEKSDSLTNEFGLPKSIEDDKRYIKTSQAFPCEYFKHKEILQKSESLERKDIPTFGDAFGDKASDISMPQQNFCMNLSQDFMLTNSKENERSSFILKSEKDTISMKQGGFSCTSVLKCKDTASCKSHNQIYMNSSSNCYAKSESGESLHLFRKMTKDTFSLSDGTSEKSYNMFILDKRSEVLHLGNQDFESQFNNRNLVCGSSFCQNSKRLQGSNNQQESSDKVEIACDLSNSVENIDFIFCDLSQTPFNLPEINDVEFDHDIFDRIMESSVIKNKETSEQNECKIKHQIPSISDMVSCSIFKNRSGSHNSKKIFINVGDKYDGERAWKKIYQLSSHLQKCSREELISYVARIKKNQNMRGSKRNDCSSQRTPDSSLFEYKAPILSSKSSIVYPCRLQQRIFRMFWKCFKLDFEEFLKTKNIIFNRVAKDMSQDTFNDFLIEFLDYYYPNILEKLDDEVLEKVMETMTLFILKDRHRKDYKITEGLDFESWNSLVNKPKSEKFIEFFSLPENSFIYCFFFYKECKYLVEDPRNSVCRKNSKDSKESLSLFNQMHELFNEFQIFIPSEVRQEIAESTALYLQRIRLLGLSASWDRSSYTNLPTGVCTCNFPSQS